MYLFNYLFYRSSLLLIYSTTGAFFICTERLLEIAFKLLYIPFFLSYPISFIIGISIAKYISIRFKLYITEPKTKKVDIIFTIILLTSYLTQYFNKLNYDVFRMHEASPIFVSTVIFILAYPLFKILVSKKSNKVGVAIYSDGFEDLKLIYNRISDFPDFIHIDIVDNSFKQNCNEVKTNIAEVIRFYWKKKKIEVHIMSRTPSIWLKELLPFVDVIYIHTSIEEDIQNILKKIESAGVEGGIAVGISEKVEFIYPYLKQVKYVLLLAIPHPGFSGQKIDMGIINWIDKLNQNTNRRNFKICVDGGVNQSNIKYLNVESVVSGSYILKSHNPIKNIMILKKSNEYEKYQDYKRSN